MLLVRVKLGFGSLLDNLHCVWIQVQIIKLQVIILNLNVNPRKGLQWFEQCRDSFLTLAGVSCLRAVIWNDNSPTAIQCIIHLHFYFSDQVSKFELRDQRSSQRSHRCEHLVLKLKTRFIARNFLKIFEKALLDLITLQLPLLIWNQSEVLGHECISILSEPNIQWMEHPLGHCPTCLPYLK